jgi:hypothetical protein
MIKYTAPLLVATFCGAPAQAALTGFWQFEEGAAATTTFDSVSGDQSDTFPAGSSIVAGGTEATSFAYDNTGQTSSFIDTNVTGAELGITGTGAKTFVSWVRSDTAGAWDDGARYGVYSYSPFSGTGSGSDLRLVIDENAGGLRFEISGGAGTANVTNLDDTQWHMIGIVIDENDTANGIQFYIDGDFVTNTSTSTTLVNTEDEIPSGLESDSTLNFIIGGDNQTDNTVQNAGQNAFNGQIDQVRVYDEALDEAALDAIFNIPEPASLTLLGLGGLLIAGRRRRA